MNVAVSFETDPISLPLPRRQLRGLGACQGLWDVGPAPLGLEAIDLSAF